MEISSVLTVAALLMPSNWQTRSFFKRTCAKHCGSVGEFFPLPVDATVLLLRLLNGHLV